MTTPKTYADWQKYADLLPVCGQAFIDGAYVDAASERTFDNISPASGRISAKIAYCETEDVERAVAAARRAADDRRWAGQPPGARKAVLQRLAALIRDHADELAVLETLDMGKPVSESRWMDIPASAATFDWYAEAIDKVYGETAPTGDDVLATITREPLGVVAAVVPWNFPLKMASWKVAPALAAGNSVILKPAEQSPLTAIRVAGLAMEAGVPPGVLNVLPGDGPGAGQPLGLHNDVDGLVFTGSTAVGKLFMQYAGQSNLKKVSLECGGKSPNIVLADAPDLDAAAAAAANGIFLNQGEVCTAGSRLIVEESIREEFVARVVAHASERTPGDPLDPETRLGALVDETQMQRVLGYIDSGREEGALLAAGGDRVRMDTGGYFVEPTVFDGVGNHMRIAREEIFGPVLSAISVSGMDEAVRIANDSEYGLGAAVWTRDINRAHYAARALKAGMVWVNCYDDDDITVPFGGYKQSGIGRDKSLHALEKYSEIKSTWIALGEPS